MYLVHLRGNAVVTRQPILSSDAVPGARASWVTRQNVNTTAAHFAEAEVRMMERTYGLRSKGENGVWTERQTERRVCGYSPAAVFR